jgi:hypothetical protein
MEPMALALVFVLFPAAAAAWVLARLSASLVLATAAAQT